MSFSGSVRCGYCYGEGHNRRTCPDFRAAIERRVERNPNDIYAKYYFDKKAKKKKTCSYCDGKGHTRPTCKELKYAKKVAVEKCSAWRHKLVKGMAEMGVGVGSLVQYRNWSKEIVGLITEIRWRELTHTLQHSSTEYGLNVQAADLTDRGRARIHLPVIEGVFEPASWAPHVQLLGPIGKGELEKQIPENFLSGEDCIELIFQENEVAKYKTRWYAITEWCPKQGFYDD